jgi:hypothetical protein
MANVNSILLVIIWIFNELNTPIIKQRYMVWKEENNDQTIYFLKVIKYNSKNRKALNGKVS